MIVPPKFPARRRRHVTRERIRVDAIAAVVDARSVAGLDDLAAAGFIVGAAAGEARP